MGQGPGGGPQTAGIDEHNLAMLPKEAEVGVPEDAEMATNLSTAKKEFLDSHAKKERGLRGLNLSIIHINHFSLQFEQLRFFSFYVRYP